MTTLKTSECPVPTLALMSAFLSRYSGSLLGSGATCIRLEKNVTRIARAYGMEAEISIMPRHVHLSVWKNGMAEAVTSIAAVSGQGISFEVNTLLSRLSWEIADGKTGFDAAVSRFDEIISTPHVANPFLPLLVALANASFCRLFGGDAVAMIIVGLATLAGYYLKIWLARRHTDVRLIVLACSFVSAVLGATDMLFSIGDTPSVALATSVLYLVPGVPFLNSFSDMLYRHYLCSISRFADALVIMCCLSVGLCAAMFLMNTGMF